MKKTYHGSCHCGTVRYAVDLDLTQPTHRCNCSICKRNRMWNAIAAPDDFRLLEGEDNLQEYRFGTKTHQHFFCTTCGVRPYGIGHPPQGTVYGVNIGCLEDATPEELDAAPVIYHDGLHDNFGVAPPFTSYL